MKRDIVKIRVLILISSKIQAILLFELFFIFLLVVSSLECNVVAMLVVTK